MVLPRLMGEAFQLLWFVALGRLMRGQHVSADIVASATPAAAINRSAALPRVTTCISMLIFDVTILGLRCDSGTIRTSTVARSVAATPITNGHAVDRRPGLASRRHSNHGGQAHRFDLLKIVKSAIHGDASTIVYG
jgi:hypothetical protein